MLPLMVNLWTPRSMHATVYVTECKREPRNVRCAACFAPRRQICHVYRMVVCRTQTQTQNTGTFDTHSQSAQLILAEPLRSASSTHSRAGLRTGIYRKPLKMDLLVSILASSPPLLAHISERLSPPADHLFTTTLTARTSARHVL